MTAVSFTTIAQPNPRALVLIEVPESLVAKLGAGKRVPVRVVLNGVDYRSTIAVYGGRYYLPARKEICEKAKLVPGGRARVSLEVDAAPRTVEVPADLAGALAAAKLRSGFDAFFFFASQGIRGLDHIRQARGDSCGAHPEGRCPGSREGKSRLDQVAVERGPHLLSCWVWCGRVGRPASGRTGKGTLCEIAISRPLPGRGALRACRAIDGRER